MPCKDTEGTGDTALLVTWMRRVQALLWQNLVPEFYGCGRGGADSCST